MQQTVIPIHFVLLCNFEGVSPNAAPTKASSVQPASIIRRDCRLHKRAAGGQSNGYGLVVAKSGNGLQNVLGLNFDCVWICLSKPIFEQNALIT